MFVKNYSNTGNLLILDLQGNLQSLFHGVPTQLTWTVNSGSAGTFSGSTGQGTGQVLYTPGGRLPHRADRRGPFRCRLHGDDRHHRGQFPAPFLMSHPPLPLTARPLVRFPEAVPSQPRRLAHTCWFLSRPDRAGTFWEAYRRFSPTDRSRESASSRAAGAPATRRRVPRSGPSAEACQRRSWHKATWNRAIPVRTGRESGSPRHGNHPGHPGR